MIFSRTFDTKCRMLTGLKFAVSLYLFILTDAVSEILMNMQIY